MDIFEFFKALFNNIGFVLGELAFLSILFLSLYNIIRILFRKVTGTSFLKKYDEYFQILLKKIKRLLIYTYIILLIALIGYDSYLIYKDIYIYQKALYWLSRVPSEYWTQFLFGVLKTILAAILAHCFIKLSSEILDKVQFKVKSYRALKVKNETIESIFFRLLEFIKNGTKFLILIYAMSVLLFSEMLINNMYLVFKVYLILAGGDLLIRVASAIVESVESFHERKWYPPLRVLLTLFKSCLEYIAYLWIISLIMLQSNFFSKYVPIGKAGIEIIGIFFITRLVIEILKVIIDKYTVNSEDELLNQQRETLIPIIKSVMKTTAYFVAFVFMLTTLNINPLPILAGAGIFGIVIGMGAQSLINDIVAGIFILFESIFLVGDYIETGSVKGVVESIFLRTTKVRGHSGQLHILRNGQINEVENYSRRYTLAVVEVGVAYDSNLKHVFSVLNDIGRRLKEKNSSVLKELEVMGIKEFGESGLLIRTTTKVRPGHHFRVAYELRTMIKNEFDIEGIEIPFVRRVVIFKNQNETE